MCLLTLIPTANKDGKIQQENQLTSNEDGSKDLQIQQFSNIEESKECEYSSTLQYKAEPPLKLEMIRNETIFTYPFSVQRQLKIQKAREQRGFFRRILEVSGYDYSYYKRLTSERKEKKELKEYIRHMFLMMLLFLLIKYISGNITCRQTSCRKYPCLNSILFLLWQSGDIETNPGPPKSISYRNWLYDTCSVVRKVIAGVSTDCKMKKIWQQPPENWPSEEPFFDPRNSRRKVNEVETFLQILIQCCGDNSQLSHAILSEIDTWKSHNSKDNSLLLNSYTTRMCCRSTEQSMKILQSQLSDHEVLIIEVNTYIQVSLSCQPAKDQQGIKHKIYRAEATRKIASFLCRIVHGKDPEEKCDNIWTIKPEGWPSNCRYYNPNNGGKRCFKKEDEMLVQALITLCEQKSIIFPKPYHDMVEVWQTDDQTLLSKLITRHTAQTGLKKEVRKLYEEGLLQDSDVAKYLKELGLLVQFKGSPQNARSKKRKALNANTNREDKRARKQNDDEKAVDAFFKEMLSAYSSGEFLDKTLFVPAGSRRQNGMEISLLV